MPACPSCGAEAKYRFRKNACDILRCSACRLEFVHPIPPDDELAKIYDDKEFFDYTAINRVSGAPGASDAGGEDAAVAETPPTSVDMLPAASVMANGELLAFAAARLGGPGRLLDVGCGNGPLLLCARDLGWDAHGLETSAWAVGFANETLGLDVRRGVLEGNPFQGEQFDVLSMVHCLEHMPRPVESLIEARKLLRPGGLLHVQVPNAASLGCRLSGASWRVYVPPSHLWYFSLRNLEAVLAQAGLRVFAAENRVLAPRFWRDERVGVDRPQVHATTSTGTIDPASAKQRLKRLVRAPLACLWLLDDVHVWAEQGG